MVPDLHPPGRRMPHFFPARKETTWAIPSRIGRNRLRRTSGRAGWTQVVISPRRSLKRATREDALGTSTPTCTASARSRRRGGVDVRAILSFCILVFDMAGTSRVKRASYLRKSCLRTAPRPAYYLSEPQSGGRTSGEVLDART